MADKITLSVIKADVGGYIGHCSVHPALLARAAQRLAKAREDGLIIDGHVSHVGDDINLIMTHRRGEDSADIHEYAWDTFVCCTDEAKCLKLYGAGQDLLADAFSGNVKGMGPGVAEMEFEERASEPVIVFMADKTSPGAWNLPLYRIFADPFNTAGLVIDPRVHAGFAFEVLDLMEHKRILFQCPEEIYDMLVFIGAPGRYCIRKVWSRDSGMIAASSSTQRLSLIAGKYVGKDDPVMIIRCQSGLPAVGEAIEPFSKPHLVPGWMRGSHVGPLMPCSVAQARPSRFDGPPRVVALGFQIAEGRLVGPQDMFEDISFDLARQTANQIAEYMRSMGPFEPHRLPLEDMEYTTLPEVTKKLAGRFEKME